MYILKKKKTYVGLLGKEGESKCHFTQKKQKIQFLLSVTENLCCREDFKSINKGLCGKKKTGRLTVHPP